MKRVLAVALLAGGLSGCDECRSYSDFSCSQIERASYHVHFSMPGGQQQYLGRTDGLKSCGSIAYSFASSKGMQRGDGWGYVCCMEANGSNCYEKHR